MKIRGCFLKKLNLGKKQVNRKPVYEEPESDWHIYVYHNLPRKEGQSLRDSISGHYQFHGTFTQAKKLAREKIMDCFNNIKYSGPEYIEEFKESAEMSVKLMLTGDKYTTYWKPTRWDVHRLAGCYNLNTNAKPKKWYERVCAFSWVKQKV